MSRVAGVLGRVLWSRYYVPLSVALTVVLLTGIGVSLFLRDGALQSVFLQPHPTIAITGPGVTSTPQPLEAYVLGAVIRPGAYTLYDGAQVRDLVVAAGGLLDSADITRVNLAATLVDRQSVYVPRLGEQAPVELGGLINLNAASAMNLHNALNITTAIANRIVAYRAAHGPYTAVNQLLLVPVSKATYDRIKIRSSQYAAEHGLPPLVLCLPLAVAASAHRAHGARSSHGGEPSPRRRTRRAGSGTSSPSEHGSRMLPSSQPWLPG